MAFKENETQDSRVHVEGLLDNILGTGWRDVVSDWTSHDEAVEQAVEPDEDTEVYVDLSAASLIDKVGMVCHDVFNKVLTGELIIETGEELLAMTQAAAIREQLRGQ